MTENRRNVCEVVDALVSRGDVLDALSSGPEDVRDLRDELDCSRSTAYKAVRELRAEGLVEAVGGDYRLTLLGRLLYRCYRSLLSEIGDVLVCPTVLSTLPADVPLDPAAFAGASLTEAGPPAPDSPIEALESFVGEAERFRCFAPVQRARNHAYAEELIDSDVRIELLTEREVIEFAIANHPDTLRRIIESDNTAHYETDESLPFGLVVVDEPERRIGVTLYDERTRLRGFLESDDLRAYEWGDELYCTYRENGTRLTGAAVAADG